MGLVALELPTPEVLALARTLARPVRLVVPAVLPVRAEVALAHLTLLRQAAAPRAVGTGRRTTLVPTGPSIRPAPVRVAVPLAAFATLEVPPVEAFLVARPIRVAAPTRPVLGLARLAIRVAFLGQAVPVAHAGLGASAVLATSGRTAKAAFPLVVLDLRAFAVRPATGPLVALPALAWRRRVRRASAVHVDACRLGPG